MTELKACPFCGVNDVKTMTIADTRYIECNHCQCQMFVEQWQKRPLEEALQKRLDEQTEAIRKARDEIADMCGNGAMFAGRVLDEYLGDYLPKEDE